MVARAYSAYTVGDIIRLNIGFMRKYENPDAVRDQIKYVSLLAHANPYILNASYLALLCEDGDKNRPILDKSLINKTIFEYMQQFKSENVDDQLQLIDSIVSEYTSNYPTSNTDDLSDRVRRLERNVADRISGLESYQVTNNGWLDDNSDNTREIEEIEEQIERQNNAPISKEHWVLSEARKIVAQGDWKLVDNKNDKLYFVSSSDIYCRNFSPAAGIDKTLNFGKFLLTVDNKGRLRSYGLQDTIELQQRGPEHPHISGGSICWGNMRDDVDNLRVNRNIISAVQIFNQLLRDYSPTAPYRRFSSFSRRVKHRTTRTFYALENSYTEKVAKHVHPNHKPFNIDDYEIDETRTERQLTLGEYVSWTQYNETRYGVITGLGSRVRVYRLSTRCSTNLYTSNLTFYKLKETKNDETNQEGEESPTEAPNTGQTLAVRAGSLAADAANP